MKYSNGLLLGATLCCTFGPQSMARERPNILWLTFEDTSASEFGCYGNPYVHTPVIDSLAERSVRFTRAWSSAPQSSPSRSSLITGCYATTFGMDLHPVPADTPSDIFFTRLLRDAGYYCVNNNKTHYNTTCDHASLWDECSRTASYHSPYISEGQPWFAVYNSVTSHMGRVRTFHTDGRRDYLAEGIDTSSLRLPPHVPDLPEARSDYAAHLEAVQDIDRWVGIFLDDLKANGLDDNTIIFFFSDHGGCLPRGKGYLYESGLQVPLLVYFPEKWKHLANGHAGKDGRLVSFVDIAPTTLSLAGIEPPRWMQGRPFFGRYEKHMPPYQFAFAANHLHHFTPARAVSDGRFDCLRSFVPYRQFALRNYYQWGMPANRAWDRMVLEGRCTEPSWEQPYHSHPAVMLFDTSSDPFQIHDLSSDPSFRKQRMKLERALRRHIRKTGDLGFFLPETRASHNLHTWVKEIHFPLRRLQNLAWEAGICKAGDAGRLRSFLGSDIPEFRYWAAVAFAHLGESGQLDVCPAELLALLSDDNIHVACEAAIAVSWLGHSGEGVARLISEESADGRKVAYSALECLSLCPGMQPEILKHLDTLTSAAETLPRTENEDPGLMARGILVNLGRMSVDDMYGPESYEAGVRLNAGRRPTAPLPDGSPVKNAKHRR